MLCSYGFGVYWNRLSFVFKIKLSIFRTPLKTRNAADQIARLVFFRHISKITREYTKYSLRFICQSAENILRCSIHSKFLKIPFNMVKLGHINMFREAYLTIMKNGGYNILYTKIHPWGSLRSLDVYFLRRNDGWFHCC